MRGLTETQPLNKHWDRRELKRQINKDLDFQVNMKIFSIVILLKGFLSTKLRFTGKNNPHAILAFVDGNFVMTNKRIIHERNGVSEFDFPYFNSSYHIEGKGVGLCKSENAERVAACGLGNQESAVKINIKNRKTMIRFEKDQCMAQSRAWDNQLNGFGLVLQRCDEGDQDQWFSVHKLEAHENHVVDPHNGKNYVLHGSDHHFSTSSSHCDESTTDSYTSEYSHHEHESSDSSSILNARVSSVEGYYRDRTVK